MATGTPVTVRLDDETLRELDEWRARQRPIPSRPEALRIALLAMLRNASATS